MINGISSKFKTSTFGKNSQSSNWPPGAKTTCPDSMVGWDWQTGESEKVEAADEGRKMVAGHVRAGTGCTSFPVMMCEVSNLQCHITAPSLSFLICEIAASGKVALGNKWNGKAHTRLLWIPFPFPSSPWRGCGPTKEVEGRMWKHQKIFYLLNSQESEPVR